MTQNLSLVLQIRYMDCHCLYSFRSLKDHSNRKRVYIVTPVRVIAPILTFLIGMCLIRFVVPGNNWSNALLISSVMVMIYYALSYIFERSSQKSHSADQRLPFFKGETRLAASLREAIIIVDDRLRMVHINPAAHALFPDIRVGESLSSVSRHDNLEGLAGQALSGDTPEPFVFQVYDPIERHIRVTGSILRPEPVLDEKSRAVIIFYDVTDLERANALRADFLANASHELKTPVASLLGYIETLRGHAKDDPEAQSMFLGIMQQQAERMQRLISDILSLRRIELSEHKTPTETADLYLAFLAAKESVAPMAKQSGIKIKYEGPKELLVLGQQDELVQLVLNIIDNGVKMTEDDQNIIVTGERVQQWEPTHAFPEQPIGADFSRRRIVTPPETNEGFAQIRIRDGGPGFKKEHLPRLSERFYRVAGDRSSKEKGTGLGLAIVKHIIKRHRGGLLIETAEGIGTEFSILIPLAGTPDNDAEPPLNPAPISLARGTYLPN